LLTSPRYC